MTTLLYNQRERGRFMRFAVVGAIGAVVDFGIMNLMVRLFNTSLVVAGTVSFIAAIISNFTWNRFWTYPDSRSKPVSSQLVQFVVVSVAGLVIRVPILAIVEPVLHRFFDMTRMSLSLSDFLAKNGTLALAVGIVMFWNFFINRYWTYNDVN
jgi:putative flippase GtrA